MSRSIVKRPQAERDLRDHFLYIGMDSEPAAMRFLEDAQLAFATIAEMPGTGPAWESDDPRLANIRYKVLSRRFRNYLIFYRVGQDHIEILTVIHGMRDLPNILPTVA
jgi:toxin ParE1/3/4